jgi:hypothetical protein
LSIFGFLSGPKFLINGYNIGHKGLQIGSVPSIKGANILVDNKGCIKLADFGASKKVVKLATISEAKSMKGTPITRWLQRSFVRQVITGKLICGVLAAL